MFSEVNVSAAHCKYSSNPSGCERRGIRGELHGSGGEASISGGVSEGGGVPDGEGVEGGGVGGPESAESESFALRRCQQSARASITDVV